MILNNQGWVNWYHTNLQSQVSEFKPCLGQINVHKFYQVQAVLLFKSCTINGAWFVVSQQIYIPMAIVSFQHKY